MERQCQNLRAQSDLVIRAEASSRSNPSARDVPVDGALHFSYDGPRQSISVRDTRFKLPSATLTAQGVISDHSNLQIQAVATDLHQLASLAASFRSKSEHSAGSFRLCNFERYRAGLDEAASHRGAIECSRSQGGRQ